MIPCPDCCPSCIIATDTFATDLAAFSTAGSPNVTGGLVEMTAGDRLIFTAAAAAVGDGVRIYGYLQKTSSDGTVRLIVAYSDSDNYLFGQLAIASGAGTIRLGKRVGGTETWLTDAVTVDDTSTELDALALLCLSWEPGEVQTPEEFLVSGTPTVSINGGAWASPDNIFLDDGNISSFTLIGAGATDALGGSGFTGLSVPPGSTIDGIAVGIECRYTAIGATSVTLTDLLLYDRNSNQVGDDRGTGQAVGTTYGVIGSGGAADDWNAGLTWEDINSPNFQVQIRFTADGGAIIDVDYIAVDIYFTTPARQPGCLRLSRTNAGSPFTAECITEYSAENPDDGLQAGAAVTSGDFEATELHCEYLQSVSRPTCGVCTCDAEEGEPCDCCDPDFPPASAYVIDLGVGGWTDDICGFCNTVAGEYELTSQASCSWGYTEATDCPGSSGGTCYPNYLVMSLRLVADGSTCKWQFQIGGPGICDPGDTQLGILVIYESSAMASDEDCQDMPVTLNKVTDVNDVCGGNLPASITLEAV